MSKITEEEKGDLLRYLRMKARKSIAAEVERGVQRFGGLEYMMSYSDDHQLILQCEASFHTTPKRLRTYLSILERRRAKSQKSSHSNQNG